MSMGFRWLEFIVAGERVTEYVTTAQLEDGPRRHARQLYQSAILAHPSTMRPHR